MENILFDIECCNGMDICSFGYVIFDDNFNILKNEDIVINPNRRFRLSNKDGEPRINLAYTEEEFKSSNTFDFYYQKINDLLTNRRLFAHSASCDVNFLVIACERYSLTPYDIKVYDTQLMYKADNPSKKIALEEIAKDLNICVDDITFHKSSDDAKISMEVLKALVKANEVSLAEYLKTHSFTVATYDNYRNKVERNSEVVKFLKELKRKYNNNPKNKNIEIAEDFRLSVDNYKKFLEYAYTNGYRLCHDISKVKYFIMWGKDSKRYQMLQTKENKNKKVTYFSRSWLYKRIANLSD